MASKKRSITRLQARELEGKVVPSIKLLSRYMHNTAPDAPKNDFFGYQVPAGEFVDGHGIKWQVQVSAVCAKSKFIKTNEIKPIIRKGAIMFKLRLFTKVLIDKIFGDEVAK